MARRICPYRRNEIEAARSPFSECAEVARRARESGLIRVSLQGLIDIALEAGRFREAEALWRELVVSSRADRFMNGLAIALCHLSIALAELGRIDDALAAAREATPLHAQQGTPPWVWLVSFARIAFKQGRMSDAALALGRAEAKYGSAANNKRDRDDLLALLGHSLSSPEVQSLLPNGATMTDEEAAHVAIGS